MILQPLQNGLKTTKKYDIALLNVWYDDRSIITQLGGIPSCSHLNTSDLDNFIVCNSCGAHLFHLGSEDSVLEYYKHLYKIISSINADNILISSPRYYPSEFTPVKGAKPIKPFYGEFIGVNRHLSYFYLSTPFERKQNIRYFSYFSQSDDTLLHWHNKVVGIKDDLMLLSLLPVSKEILVLNPYESDIAFGVSNIDYVVTNEAIVKNVSEV